MLTASSFTRPDLRWGSDEEIERRRRIALCTMTYAYEIADNPICSDADWDRAAQRIRPTMGTGHPLLDEFFAWEFSRMTGMWIHRHPELDRVKIIHDRFIHIVNPKHFARTYE